MSWMSPSEILAAESEIERVTFTSAFRRKVSIGAQRESCQRKDGFDSADLARMVAGRLSSHGRIKAEIYKCACCRKYHVCGGKLRG